MRASQPQALDKVRSELLQAAVDRIGHIIIRDLFRFLTDIDLRSKKWESQLDSKIGKLLDAPSDTSFLDEDYTPTGTFAYHLCCCTRQSLESILFWYNATLTSFIHYCTTCF